VSEGVERVEGALRTVWRTRIRAGRGGP
jgi:hypothetical protein